MVEAVWKNININEFERGVLLHSSPISNKGKIMRNYQKELDALKVRYDKLNEKYRNLKSESKDKKEYNVKEAEFLASMIEDIEESKTGFENLQKEMHEIVVELKEERDQYRFLISQIIQIKNEMLSGMKMSLIEKAKYKLKNK